MTTLYISSVLHIFICGAIGSIMVRLTFIFLFFNSCLFGQDSTFIKVTCENIKRLKDKDDFRGQLDIVMEQSMLYIPTLFADVPTDKLEQKAIGFSYRLERELKRTCPGFLISPSIVKGLQVVDLEDKLNKKEIDSLKRTMRAIGEEKNVYVHLVTVDDYYPHISIKEFGSNNNPDWGSVYNFDRGSVAIVISSAKREIRIATSDLAMTYLTDDECSQLIQILIPFLKKDEYFDGLIKVLAQLRQMI